MASHHCLPVSNFVVRDSKSTGFRDIGETGAEEHLGLNGADGRVDRDVLIPFDRCPADGFFGGRGNRHAPPGEGSTSITASIVSFLCRKAHCHPLRGAF
jgi:hypothetical protein